MQWRDLLSRWERASSDAESMGKRSEKAELGDQLSALDEQIKACTVTVKVRALSRGSVGHPPRTASGRDPGNDRRRQVLRARAGGVRDRPDVQHR
jgi:hypothetical protein